MADVHDELDSVCGHDVAAGFVTNQDPDAPLDMSRSHASVVVCASGVCRGHAIHVVSRFTGEPATYYSYRHRRARLDAAG